MTPDPEIHMGRGIRYLREKNKLTQDELGNMLGAPWDQKKVSTLEKKQTIDEYTLQIVAQTLNASTATLRNYSPEGSTNQDAMSVSGNTPPGTRYPHRMSANGKESISLMRDIIRDLTLAHKQQREETAALYERLMKSERYRIEQEKSMDFGSIKLQKDCAGM